MPTILEGEEFKKRWKALSWREQRRVGKYATGKRAPDPETAALAVAYARYELRRRIPEIALTMASAWAGGQLVVALVIYREESLNVARWAALWLLGTVAMLILGTVMMRWFFRRGEQRNRPIAEGSA